MRPILPALALLACACRHAPPPPVDPRLASRVPSGALLIAGIDLDRLRSSPIYLRLPASVTSLLEPYRPAHSLLFASTGADFVVLARGEFQKLPPGATLLTSDVIATGSPAAVQSAVTPHPAAEPPLLSRAAVLTPANPVWIVADGRATLPVSGNAGNINTLLHSTQYATLTAQMKDPVHIEITAVCTNPSEAAHLEQTIRAFTTLAAARTRNQPAIASLLKAIQINTDTSTLRLTLSVPVADLSSLPH